MSTHNIEFVVGLTVWLMVSGVLGYATIKIQQKQPLPSNNEAFSKWLVYVAVYAAVTTPIMGWACGELTYNLKAVYPIHWVVNERPTVNIAEKALGDNLMEKYIFGGWDEKTAVMQQSGYRLFYEEARSHYYSGGVAVELIRSTIWQLEKRADREVNKPAFWLAKASLAETF